MKAIRKYVDELFIIFPFERDYFPKHGIRPIFEGNPLVDAIEARRASLPSPDEFRRRHALDERPIVALLAGSRRSEIKANLPLMADLARKFPTGNSWSRGFRGSTARFTNNISRTAASATSATKPTKHSRRPKPPS